MRKTTEYSDKLCSHGHVTETEEGLRSVRYRITGVCADCQAMWGKRSRDKRREHFKNDLGHQEAVRVYNRNHARKYREEHLEEVQEYQKNYHAKRRAVIQEERRIRKILQDFSE